MKNKLKVFFRKNEVDIYNYQIVTFVLFDLLTIIYYQCKSIHRSFNRLYFVKYDNIGDIFSLFMTWLFAIFIWIVIIYPILYILQLIYSKQQDKWKKILLFLLYFSVLFSIFSLYSISISNVIREKG